MKLVQKTLTLVLGLLLALGSAGLALGQAVDNQALGQEDEQIAIGQEDEELFGGLPFEEFYQLGLEDPAAAQDFNLDADRIQEVDRNVDLEQDDLFNVLAITANNDQDVQFNDIANIETTERMVQNAEATSDFEEETVFAALALGMTADNGELETLAAAGGDVARELTVERTAVQDIDLDREDTLFAIALANSAGSELDWRDVADVNRAVATSVDASQDVELSTEDAFLALALGITGDGEEGFGGDQIGGEEEQTLGGEEQVLGGEEEQTLGGEEEQTLGGEEEPVQGIVGPEEEVAQPLVNE